MEITCICAGPAISGQHRAGSDLDGGPDGGGSSWHRRPRADVGHRLYAEWRRGQGHHHKGRLAPPSHVERLLVDVPRDGGIVTVIDGHPAALSWLGGVAGHRVKSLGVDAFGQTGTVADLYRHFGFDAENIMRAVESASPG